REPVTCVAGGRAPQRATHERQGVKERNRRHPRQQRMKPVLLPRRADAQVQVDLCRGGDTHSWSASPSARAQNCQDPPVCLLHVFPSVRRQICSFLLRRHGYDLIRLLPGNIRYRTGTVNRNRWIRSDQSVGRSTLSFLSSGEASTCLLALM